MKTHKAIRLVMLLTILFLQITFLAMIIRDKYDTDSFAAIFSVLLIIFTLFFGYKYLDFNHAVYAYEKFSIVVWVPIGAVLCYLLTVYSTFNAVISAGIIGAVASFLPLLNQQSNYLKKIPTAIYCGAFVGMSSVAIMPSISYVIAGGVAAGVLLSLSKSLFIGMGGKLGTVAFGGVVFVSFMYWIAA